MDTLDKIIFPLKVAAIDAERHKDAAVVRRNPKIDSRREALKTPDELKIASLAAVGIAAIAVAGVLAYRKHQQAKPMTRLQHLKAQLGLTDADFKDLKANLSKLNVDQLRELNKAAW